MRVTSFLVGCFVVALAGCATAPGSAVDEDRLPQTEATTVTGVSAADSLLQQGEQARAQGDYSAAIHLLERGLRLAPRSASFYLALAKTRLAMADFSKAQQMAQRAISLLPSEPRSSQNKMKAEAWDVIAQARSEAGDSMGADRARANAKALR